MVVLRQFLYRDDDLIREFIAQLEGGVFDEDTRTSRTSGKKTAGGEIGAGPLRARAEGGRENAEEVARTVRQTGASEFERFHRALEEEDNIL